jgi:hypothetical protein
MKAWMSALMALLIVTSTGCAEPAVEVLDESVPLYFETIGRGQYGEIRDTVEVVVRGVGDWNAISATMRPLADFESVDFAQSMVAMIALPAESGGYTIEVESVEELDGRITISYLVSEPGIDCITPSALALPFQAVTIQQTEGEVIFERRSEQYTCEM